LIPKKHKKIYGKGYDIGAIEKCFSERNRERQRPEINSMVRAGIVEPVPPGMDSE